MSCGSIWLWLLLRDYRVCYSWPDHVGCVDVLLEFRSGKCRAEYVCVHVGLMVIFLARKARRALRIVRWICTFTVCGWYLEFLSIRSCVMWSRTLDTDCFIVAVHGNASVRLRTETLGGEFTGFVFFPVDFHVFYVWM